VFIYFDDNEMIYLAIKIYYFPEGVLEMKSEKKKFTPSEEKKIQKAVNDYKKKVRDKEIEYEIKRRIQELDLPAV
jgi:hypothetical protein